MTFVSAAYVFSIGILASVFFVSGVAKVVTRRSLRESLSALHFIPIRMAPFIAYSLPVIEIGVAGLLLSERRLFVQVGGGLALALLCLFNSVAIVAMQQGLGDVQCACFGPLSHGRFDHSLVLRNMLLMALGAAVIVYAVMRIPSYPPLSTMILTVIVPTATVLPMWEISTHFIKTRKNLYTGKKG